jgi:maleate isomerase
MIDDLGTGRATGKRAGLIIPAPNQIVEKEMVRAFPSWLCPHVTRLRMTGAQRKPLHDLLPDIGEATRALLDARCDVVAFHCSVNSMHDGERLIQEEMSKAGAAKVTTTAQATRKALQAVEARNIVLLTPYTQPVTDHEAEFLCKSGFSVLAAKGLNLGGAESYAAALPAFWRERLVKAAMPDADAYLVSCANITVFEAIDNAEMVLGRPVITSNQAVLWNIVVDLQGDFEGRYPGRLFNLVPNYRSHQYPARVP